MWEIQADSQYRITINFTHFDIEGNPNSQQQQCDYDRIDLYSIIKEGKLKKHGAYCGPKAPGLITSEGNIMRIVFSSDSSVQKSGFAAVFFTGKAINIRNRVLLFVIWLFMKVTLTVEI